MRSILLCSASQQKANRKKPLQVQQVEHLQLVLGILGNVTVSLKQIKLKKQNFKLLNRQKTAAAFSFRQTETDQ